jgi:hypothetical protein
VKLFFFALYFLVLPLCLNAQTIDTILPIVLKVDSVKLTDVKKQAYIAMLDSNIFINAKAEPKALASSVKKHNSQNLFFYLIGALFLLLGITRSFYSRYFTTLFRVFFNTSLRQNQLTDQLEQAKLPSLIFNVFFIVTAGVYIYFLIHFFSPQHIESNSYLILSCILAVAICYIIKYFSVLFIGWLANAKAEAGTYIFIIFLLNKVMGIFFLLLLPILAFAGYSTVSYVVLLSLICVSLILLIRFFRSYSLLQAKLKVTKFHFLIYIIALEILPIAIIYKFIILYFNTKS